MGVKGPSFFLPALTYRTRVCPQEKGGDGRQLQFQVPFYRVPDL
jgi:hypothetical protein